MLFDVDDTLVDFGGAARLALADVVRDHLADLPDGPHRLDGPVERSPGLLDAAHLAWQQVSETEYQRFTAGEVDFDQMRINRMAAFLRAIDRPGADRLSHELLEAHRNSAIFGHFQLFDDVPACLGRLRRAGVTVRVLSNSDGAYQRAKLAAVGLGDLGDSGFYSGEWGFAKPDPRIFRAAAAALGLPTDQIIYVGDRWDVDVIGSAAVGMRPVWLNRLGERRRPDWKPAGSPVQEIASLDRLNLEL